jgi:hypothetical protein
MHWREPREREHYLSNDIVVTREPHRINSPIGTTQLISLESHRRKKKTSLWTILYNIILNVLAAYGLYKLVIESIIYYIIFPDLNRVWKWLL